MAEGLVDSLMAGAKAESGFDMYQASVEAALADFGSQGLSHRGQLGENSMYYLQDAIYQNISGKEGYQSYGAPEGFNFGDYTGKEEWIRPPNADEIKDMYKLFIGDDEGKGIISSMGAKEKKYWSTTMEPMYNEWLNRQGE